MNRDKILLQVVQASKNFQTRQGVLQAVLDVSFDLHLGETLALVGESGCGKSTLGRLCLLLYSLSSGEIYFEGKPLSRLKPRAMRRQRRHMQMIFQDPDASFDPRLTVQEAVCEPLQVQRLYTQHARRDLSLQLLQKVGLSAHHLMRFPHEFSGGQRQRIAIARALSLQPKFIVCDEPVSALDVSVQAQVVNLLQQLQEELNLSYLFISHQLPIVRQISHRIAVMYLGRFVELAESQELFLRPLHPYTQLLLACSPSLHRGAPRSLPIAKEAATLFQKEEGCPFQKRCPHAMKKCQNMPEWKEVSPGHFVACHLY